MTDLADRASATTAATTAPAAAAPRRRRESRHWWFAVCALAMLVASDYKFRVRDPSQTYSDNVDIAVLLEIATYGAVAVYLLGTRPPRLRLRRLPMPLFAATALVVLMVLSLPRSSHLTVELVRAFQMVVILSVSVALLRRGTRVDVHVFAHWFLVLCAASVAFGVVHPMPRFASQQDRFTWLRIHPVTSAVFVAIATLIAAAYLLHHRRPRPGPHWPPYVYALLGLVVAGGLYATKTRGAVLGAVLGLLVLVWLMLRGRRRVELFVLIVVGAIGFGLAASSQIVAYIQRGESANQLATLNSRTELWDVAWAFVREKPLYGYGIGASHSLFLDSTGLGGAHNALVNIIIDLGVVGTLVWAWLILGTAWTVLRVRATDPTDTSIRLDRALLLALLVLLGVNGVSNGGLGDEANVSSTLLFLIAAWSCLLVRESGGPARRVSRRTARARRATAARTARS